MSQEKDLESGEGHWGGKCWNAWDLYLGRGGAETPPLPLNPHSNISGYIVVLPLKFLEACFMAKHILECFIHSCYVQCSILIELILLLMLFKTSPSN